MNPIHITKEIPLYTGIKIDKSWTYTASLYYRFPSISPFIGNLTLGLKNSLGEVVATTSAPIDGSRVSWERVEVQLKPNESYGFDGNSFFVTFNNAGNRSEVVNFAMFSLFPPTFKDRPNGMRIDLAEVIQSFLYNIMLPVLMVSPDPRRDGSVVFPFSRRWKPGKCLYLLFQFFLFQF